MSEDFLYTGIQFDTILVASLRYREFAERVVALFLGHRRKLLSIDGLQTDDKLIILVNIACGVGGDCGNRLGVNASDTTSVAFFCKSFQTFVPQFHSTG